MVAEIRGFWLNFWYRIFGDKNPNAFEVLRQLKEIPANEYNNAVICKSVYSQSYSAIMKRSRDDFVLGIPLKNHSKRGKKIISLTES